MIYITIGVLATAFSVAWLAPGVRASHPWPVARAMLVSFFEWFGELGLFCSRLVRAALAPPYEGREFVRQMDAVGSQSLPPSPTFANSYLVFSCRRPHIGG